MLLTLALASMVPQGPGSSLAPVVINEFQYDDNGTDDVEYVELFNRTALPVDISGWMLQGEEGGAAGGINGTFTFPGTPGSMTTVILPGGYLLVSQPLVPNHDPNYVMPTTVLENGGTTTTLNSDGVTLRDDLGNVIDAVVWEYAGWAAPVPAWLEGTGCFGGYQLSLGLATLNGAAMGRWIDGFDSDDNGADFVMLAYSPGQPNGFGNTLALPVEENFDAGVGTTITNIFASSFVSPTIQDPAAITTSGVGLWTLPPSPQGGNCGTLHDNTGGGNSHISLNAVGTDYLVELYVYVPGSNAAITTAEKEGWAVGVGTTDSFGHPYDVVGTYYPGLLCTMGNGPGGTGIAWIGYQSSTQTEIYLVDLNNGGPGATVLGGPIVATAGVNDGWQRLRIRASGTSLVGNFGGTYGVDDGQRFTATITPRLFGQVYLQYRECISTNANMHPLTIDALQIYGTLDSSVTFFGTPSPTNFGTPNISTSGGMPSVGNSAFAIDCAGLVPGGISLVALDAGAPLPGIPIPGAPATMLVYAAPTVLLSTFNSLVGTASLPFAIPPTNSLIGISLVTQYFDLDPTLGVPLPFGSSRGAQLLIGNG